MLRAVFCSGLLDVPRSSNGLLGFPFQVVQGAHHIAASSTAGNPQLVVHRNNQNRWTPTLRRQQSDFALAQETIASVVRTLRGGTCMPLNDASWMRRCAKHWEWALQLGCKTTEVVLQVLAVAQAQPRRRVPWQAMAQAQPRRRVPWQRALVAWRIPLQWRLVPLRRAPSSRRSQAPPRQSGPRIPQFDQGAGAEAQASYEEMARG